VLAVKICQRDRPSGSANGDHPHLARDRSVPENVAGHSCARLARIEIRSLRNLDRSDPGVCGELPRPSPVADSQRLLPSLWHPSRCTLSEAARQSFAYLPAVAGSSAKGSQILLSSSGTRTVARGRPAKWANWKNKEGIRAMKTARGLRGRSNGDRCVANVVKRASAPMRAESDSLRSNPQRSETLHRPQHRRQNASPISRLA